MTTELRKSGIDIVDDMPWGTHFCHFYETREDLLDILIPYFKAGLENNELCVWVVFDPLNERKAVNALRRNIPEADRYLAEGRIEIVTHSELYLKDGSFDLEQVINIWNEKLAEALAIGYDGIRINGNEAWVTEKQWEDFSEYEKKLNEMIAGRRMIVLCTYPLVVSRGSEIFDVARTHQFAIARRHGSWDVVEPPDILRSKQEIKRLNEELEQRVADRTRELEATNEKLRREIAERERAEEELRRTSDQLRALAASLTSAREAEGIRIAREIHDELGSALTSLRWELESCDKIISKSSDQLQPELLREKIAPMIKLTDATINTVRRISSELRPSILDDLGLVEAIEWQAQQFQAQTGIICHCDCALENLDLSQEKSIALFRIFQEALTNVLRHALATKVDINIEEKADEFILTTSDNGKGITESQKSDSRSLGLLGMRERAHLVGGEIEITGTEGRDTVVTVRVPISG
jgi:signal transduction histidine kinase